MFEEPFLKLPDAAASLSPWNGDGLLLGGADGLGGGPEDLGFDPAGDGDLGLPGGTGDLGRPGGTGDLGRPLGGAGDLGRPGPGDFGWVGLEPGWRLLESSAGAKDPVPNGSSDYNNYTKYQL